QQSNSSSISQFLLLAFADRWELQLLHFWLFLGIYLAALLGNGLIITTIACDHHLHTPMYFFLLNLSLLDLGSISTTLPKAMASSLWDNTNISYKGCAAQNFFVFFITGEFSLLTIMSYDCYVAICKPLHYRTLLGSRACVHMAAAARGAGGRHKAFSMCLPHLAVVSLFISTAIFAYLKPHSISSPSLDLVVSFLYSVVPPAVKPLIYSMRNQELKGAFSKRIT
ncbi:Olfactory receptor 14I1, partial [Calypte anna]